MDYEAWKVAENCLSAVHASGYSIQVEGNPRAPTAVIPKHLPKDLTALQAARLLRFGVESIVAAAKARKAGIKANKPRSQFQRDPSKPRKPTLSFKSRSRETETDPS